MLLVYLLAAPSLAGTSVLVSRFEPTSVEAVPAAQSLGPLLLRELEGRGDYQLLDPAGVPEVGGMGGGAYLDDCPPGQFEGCSYLVGQAAGARYALAGQVQPPAGEGEPYRVDFFVLDVEEMREAAERELDYDPSEPGPFVEQVDALLGGVLAGELGQLRDIRLQEQPEPEPRVLDEEERDLSALAAEMGEVAPSEPEPEPRREFRPHYTLQELLDEKGDEAPWKELGLTPRQYLQWWNSGWNLESWLPWLQGREGRLLLRLGLHAGYGPSSTRYGGSYALQSNNLELREVYAYQEVQDGFGAGFELGAGYGVTPVLEAEGWLAVVSGRYRVEVKQEVYGVETVWRNRTDVLSTSLELGVGARWVPLPGQALRPLAGAGLALLHGSKVTAHDDLPIRKLPVFSAPNVLLLRGLAGGELRVSDHVDLYAGLPLSLVLAGGAPQVHDERGFYVTDKVQPSRPFPLGAGLELGLQLRFGGPAAASPELGGPPAGEPEEDEDL